MLTDLAIQGLKPTGKQYLKWDMPNFGVLVSQRGTKSYVVQFPKIRKKEVVARYGQLTLKEARYEAQKPAPALQATRSSLCRHITCRR